MNSAQVNFDNKALAAALEGNVAENARKLGISRGHLNNVLKGTKKPSIDLLIKIIKTFQLEPQRILRGN